MVWRTLIRCIYMTRFVSHFDLYRGCDLTRVILFKNARGLVKAPAEAYLPRLLALGR